MRGDLLDLDRQLAARLGDPGAVTGDPALARRVLDAAGDVVGRRILDAGCGSGELAAAMAALGGRVSGMDACPSVLERASRGAALGVDLVRGDGDRLPFRSGAFDLVTSVLVLHHLRAPERALSELFRVLQPGGRFVLADRVTTDPPSFRAEHLRIERLRNERIGRLHSPAELGRAVAAAGFALSSGGNHTWTLSLDRWLRGVEEARAGEIRGRLERWARRGSGGIGLAGADTLRLRIRLVVARRPRG